MNLSWLFIPAGLMLFAAEVNLTRRQWLVNLIALAAQYLGMFLLLTLVRPPTLAAIKLIVGWMDTLVLYITLASVGEFYTLKATQRLSSGQIFRFLAGLFMIVFTIVFLPQIQSLFLMEGNQPLLLAAVGTMLLGLLQVSMISEPFYIILGLLTFLSGFELLYATLELSLLLEALFAGINLGLALVGAYFLVKDAEIEQP